MLEDASSAYTNAVLKAESFSQAVEGALVFANPRQMETDWTFVIERQNVKATLSQSLGSIAAQALEMTDMKFKVRQVSFSRLKLNTLRTRWGTNPFVGYDHPELVQIQMEEDVFFQSYNYFQSWQDDLFDQDTNQFQVYKDTSKIYRDGILSMGGDLPVVGIMGATFKMSKLKFVGFEPQTLVYDGEDCLVYDLTFVVETIRRVGLSAHDFAK